MAVRLEYVQLCSPVKSRSDLHVLRSTLVWNSPESVGMATGDFANKTYNVVVYYVPPFVEFEDRDALDGDPGNVMQTRTIENGGLSGLTYVSQHPLLLSAYFAISKALRLT